MPLRRKPVPIVLPALERTAPSGAEHVAVKYGHGFRPIDAQVEVTDQQPLAQSGAHTARPPPPNHVETPSNAVCSWPSNTKGGAKPELLRQLEKYVHRQLTVLHHMSGSERETQTMIRLDMARHCVRQFQGHFKIYADVLGAVGDTLDAVVAVFDLHRERITDLEADKAALNRRIEELLGDMSRQQQGHEEEMRASASLASQLKEADEDRRVLQSLCDDLQKQLSKQRQFVDAAQERLDAMSRQHVLQTMRDERQRSKVEQAEQAAADAHSRVIGLERDRKSLKMKLEIGDVETARITKELRVAQSDLSALNSVLVAKDEEIKMLRFDLKRRGGGGGPGAAKNEALPLDADTRKKLTEEITSELRRAMTPRPVWSDLDVEDPAVFPDIREKRAAVAASEAAAAEAAVAALDEVRSSGAPTPDQPELDATANSLASMPVAAGAKADGSSSATTPGAGKKSAESASLQARSDPSCAAAQMGVPLGVPSTERVTELVSRVNAQYRCGQELQAEIETLTKRLVIYETLQNTLGNSTSMQPRSPLSPLGGGGGGGEKQSKSKAAATAGSKGKKTKDANEPDNIFVPLGTASDVPWFLRAPDTNHTIAARTLPHADMCKHIFDSSRFVNLWLADMDPPRAFEKHQGTVAKVESGPTFSDGFLEWLQAELRLRRLKAGPDGLVPPPAGMVPAPGAAGSNGVTAPPALVEAVAPSGEFASEFSLEFSYSLIWNVRRAAEDGRNGLCRLFLLTLSGDLPRDTMARFAMRLRAVRRAFESVDQHGTGGVLPMEAAHALRTALPNFAAHHCDALAELLEQLQRARPHAITRVPYDELLAVESTFVQCIASFFLETLEFHLHTLSRSITLAGEGHEELPLVGVVNALQAADPRLEAEEARGFVSECCRVMVSKASKIPPSILSRRIYEVYSDRRTPIEVGALRPEFKRPCSLPKLELELALHNVGAPPKRGPHPPSRGKAGNKAVVPRR